MAGKKNNTDAPKKQDYWSYVKRQFKKNKRALWSLYFVGFLAAIALFADFIANEKPIIAKYNGRIITPIFKGYAVDLGIGQWPKDLQNVLWKNLEYDWAVKTPVPYSPTNTDFLNAAFKDPLVKHNVKSKFYHHWLGTDDLGRDVLSGMIHATRIALLVGLVSMAIATFIGILMGAFAGFFGDNRLRISRASAFLVPLFMLIGLYYAFMARNYIISDAIGESITMGLFQIVLSVVMFVLISSLGWLLARPLKAIGWFGKKVNVPADIIVSRIIEIFVSVPRLFLIIAIVAAMNSPSLFMVMLIIGATSWTGIARLIRAELLRVRSLEYIEAADALGFSGTRTLLRHAIPNALSPVLIAIAFGIAAAILIEAFLSFIGIGVPAETQTWGSLLNLARGAPKAWWLATFPGFAIFITVTVFNLIGEGLTDALDPRLKQ